MGFGYTPRDMKVVWKTKEGEERHMTGLTFGEAIKERERMVAAGFECRMETSTPAWILESMRKGR